MEKTLEKRMYMFVPYQLTGIQMGIQAGHAALNYARQHRDDLEFIEFADNWKTWIILNGGSTNHFRDSDNIPSGTLDQILDNLQIKDIKHSFFYEPDLCDALTAVCFIADERVFNYTDYPDLADFTKPLMEFSKWGPLFITGKPIDLNEVKEQIPNEYKLWEDLLGGEKNVFLRNLLRGKKLA